MREKVGWEGRRLGGGVGRETVGVGEEETAFMSGVVVFLEG